MQLTRVALCRHHPERLVRAAADISRREQQRGCRCVRLCWPAHRPFPCGELCSRLLSHERTSLYQDVVDVHCQQCADVLYNGRGCTSSHSVFSVLGSCEYLMLSYAAPRVWRALECLLLLYWKETSSQVCAHTSSMFCA